MSIPTADELTKVLEEVVVSDEFKALIQDLIHRNEIVVARAKLIGAVIGTFGGDRPEKTRELLGDLGMSPNEIEQFLHPIMPDYITVEGEGFGKLSWRPAPHTRVGFSIHGEAVCESIMASAQFSMASLGQALSVVASSMNPAREALHFANILNREYESFVRHLNKNRLQEGKRLHRGVRRK